VARLAIILLLCCAASAQTVRVRLARGGVRVVPVEEYVGWVLAGEASGMRSSAALEAMAIVARTYARHNLGRHAFQGFDFCETTHCQDARPGAVNARLRAAVNSTAGIILWWKGRPAQVFYSAHCGGRTAAAGEIWPTAARPYLPSVEDPFCLRQRSAWSARVTMDDLTHVLGLHEPAELDITHRTASGRVRTLTTHAGPVDAEHLHLVLGRALGWNLLRSRVYDVTREGQDVIFRGQGRGHGVGLCQAGADERGLEGHDWQTILAAYFPGLHAGVSARDIGWRTVRSERVELWFAGPAAPNDLAARVDRAFYEAERRAALHFTQMPQIRVYPDLNVFRDTTGEPGTVAAATRGRIVHMQPAERLRALGVLDSTLLHEMLHVLLGQHARKRLPLWFDEGLVEVLAGGGTHPAERQRVERLVRTQGRAAVLAMLETGVR
jgi:stage II sporulation protein D